MTSNNGSEGLSFSLSGQVAAVTGGASGIGAAIAGAYLAQGARVAILDLDLDAERERAASLGSGVRAFACEMTDDASVTAAAAAVPAELGPVDVLVNCAGGIYLAPA